MSVLAYSPDRKFRAEFFFVGEYALSGESPVARVRSCSHAGGARGSRFLHKLGHKKLIVAS